MSDPSTGRSLTDRVLLVLGAVSGVAGVVSVGLDPGWGAISLTCALLTLGGGCLLLAHNWRKHAVRPVVMGLVLVMVGSGIAGGMLVRAFEPGPSVASDPPGTPSSSGPGPTTPSPGETTRNTTSPTPSDGPGKGTGGGGSIEVLLDAAVDSQRCKPPNTTGVNWTTRPAQLAPPGKQGGQSVDYAAAFGCAIANGSIEGYRDYTVPTGMTRLTGVVGIDRGSANTTVRVEFSVLKDDGTPLFRQTATYDTSYAVEVPLEGVSRIRLRVRLAGFGIHPYEKDARAVWADMRFVP